MAFDAGTIESTLDLDRTPFNQGLDKAEKDARAFERKRFRAKLVVDVDKKQADAAVRQLGLNKPPKMEIEPEIDQKKVVRQIDNIAKNTELTAARSGNRIARALLNPIMIQLGLLPAAAAAASVATGAALLLPVAALGAWGIAAVKSTAEVKTAWASLKRDLTEGSKDIAAPMRDALVGIMDEARVRWAAAKPIFAGMFKEAAPLMQDFASSLMGMVTRTLPGFMVVLERGPQIMRGWDSLLDRVGVGFSDLIDEATRVEDIDAAMGKTGNTIEILMGFVGRLIGQFTTAWNVIGTGFNQTLETATDLVTKFSSGALPAMGGGLNMLLKILDGMLRVFGPFMDILGSGVGTILAAVAAYRLLAGAVGMVTRAGQAVRGGWTSAMVAMKGTSDGMLLVGTNADKMSKQVDKATESKSRFSKMASGVTGILSKVGSSLPIIGAAFAVFGGIVEAIQAESNKKFQEQRDLAERTADRVRATADRASAALQIYNRDLAILGPTSRQVQDAQEKLAQATLAEKDAQADAAQATKTHTERLLEYFDALTGGLSAQVQYNNSIKEVKEKQDALIETIKTSGKNSLDAKFATDELSLAMANQVRAAGDLAAAQAGNVSEAEKLRITQAAVGLEAVKLIDLFGSQAPPQLYKTVAAMSDTELAAIGGKREINSMGQAIIDVKGYKKITIDSNMWSEAQNALTLKQRVDNLPTGNKWLNYYINYITSGGPDPSLNNLTSVLGGRPRNAAGTANWRGGDTWVNEQGPELIQLPNGSKVFTNRSTQLMMERMMINVANASSGSGLNMPQLAAAIATAVASALSGTRLVFDGSIAQLVNRENTRLNRRRS